MTLMRTTQVNPAEEPFAMLSGIKKQNLFVEDRKEALIKRKSQWKKRRTKKIKGLDWAEEWHSVPSTRLTRKGKPDARSEPASLETC